MAPIFIVGVGRSGTSLLQTMLASHSLIAFPPETGFVRRYVGTGRLKAAERARGWRDILNLLNGDDHIRRLGVDVSAAVAASWAGHRVSEKELYEQLLSQVAQREAKPLVGDKDPRLVEFLPLLSRLWPDAFVIHVVRDPRDVLASKKIAAWSRNRSSWWHMLAGAIQIRAGRVHGSRLFGDRYIEVRYEELIEKPTVVLHELARRLKIPYEEGMLDFSAAGRALVTEEEMPWKKETLGALLTRNTGKWRQALSKREAALCELLAPGSVTQGCPARAVAECSHVERMGLRTVACVFKGAAWCIIGYKWCNTIMRARRVKMAGSGAG